MDSQEWGRRYAGTGLVWMAEPNRFVVAEPQDLAPGRALEVAAGEGRNAVWLASRGWQVTAVDFSAAGLDKGRRLAQARGVGIDWVHADVRDYQPEAGSFQLVLVAYLQLREAELDGVLRRAATALAPVACCWWWATTWRTLPKAPAARPTRLSCTRRSPSRAPSRDSPWSGPSESGVLWPPLTATARRWTPWSALSGLTTARERPVVSRRAGCSASVAG